MRSMVVLMTMMGLACGGQATRVEQPRPSARIVVPETTQMREAPGCARLANMDATFVMYVPARDEWRVCGAARASARYLPASTFKVVNALIGLETGVVSDADAMVAWDGVTRMLPAWNQDTSLRTGMRNSTVWFYQALARNIGFDTMARWVTALDYGNHDIGPSADIDRFWLDGVTRISALEQVAFLDQLRRRALPMSERSQATVIDILERERTVDASGATWTLRGKTGAALATFMSPGASTADHSGDDPLRGAEPVGWFVGWTEHADHDGAVFAFNMRLADESQLPLREALAKQLLADSGTYASEAP